MIYYPKINIGDTLKITGDGAPGYAENGELVTVLAKTERSVKVVNKHGEIANFINDCGAARLSPVEQGGELV